MSASFKDVFLNAAIDGKRKLAELKQHIDEQAKELNPHLVSEEFKATIFSRLDKDDPGGEYLQVTISNSQIEEELTEEYMGDYLTWVLIRYAPHGKKYQCFNEASSEELDEELDSVKSDFVSESIKEVSAYVAERLAFALPGDIAAALEAKNTEQPLFELIEPDSVPEQTPRQP
jgi:hypothetical protein